MDNRFFEQPILYSPYEYPPRHWELDTSGQPTQQIVERRRRAEFITPIPKPRKRRGGAADQQDLLFDDGKGISTQQQRYDPTSIINALRIQVDRWRSIPNPNDWKVTPETTRLLQHWRHHQFNGKGGTYPAQLMYQELADMACERITAGITRALVGERPIKAMLDPYNPTGSTSYVSFNTSKKDRWETDSRRCQVNWVILDSDWEAEFCRVAEAHPKVIAYVKNHNLGLEVPYRYGSESRRYLPDFIVLVDDGKGDDDLLHLIVEIKGYRREDAKEKKSTMETYWVPGVNNQKSYGRWAFAEFTEVYQIETDFEAKVESEFAKMIEGIVKSEG